MVSEDSQKKRNRKTVILVILIAVIIGLLVHIYTVRHEFLYAGTLDATKVDLSPELPSRIEMVNVHEGDHVVADQDLIKLSCEDYHANYKLASSDYKRNLELFDIGYIRNDTLDLFLNHQEIADIHIDWCSIKSPINGVVLSRYHEPGEYASPGLKILTLANIRDIWAYIYVPQPKIAQLKLGMELTGTLPEMPDKTFKGKIIKINSEAEFTPKNVQTRSERTRLIYGVKVSFLGSNDDEILKPGMTIEIALPEDES